MSRRRSSWVAVLPMVVGLSFTSAAHATNIRIQSTTDIKDSGLFDERMVDAYATAQPGDTLTFTTAGGTVYPSFVGTGVALDRARAGLADIVVTHAPSLESSFITDGYTYDIWPGPGGQPSPYKPLGRAVFYNDYVIVGPTGDPAGVFTDASTPPAKHDAVLAFKKIAARGVSNGDVTFVSRGDNSGTNVQEQFLWNRTSGTVTVQTASNAGGDASRKEPGSGGTYPSWYKKSNQGQAASLATTNTCSAGFAPNGGCYTMLDKGTWLNKTSVSGNLKLVSSDNDPAADGGADLQANLFHAYAVNPAKAPFASGVTPDTTAALRFLNFLTSSAFQTSVASWPSSGNPGFSADAFPDVSSVSGSCSAGTLTASATFKYAAPITSNAISGIPVRLETAPVGSSTWTNRQTNNTNGSGVVSFSVGGLSGSLKARLFNPDDYEDSGTNFSRFTSRATKPVNNVGGSSMTC